MRREGLAVLLAVLLASVLAGPVAAVDSSPQTAPDASEVDSEFDATYELTNLFEDFEGWTLVGETELESVTWTVQQYDQAGNQVAQDSYNGQSFSRRVDIETGVSRIEVRVTGTAPAFGSPTYDPPQRFTAANFRLDREGGTQQAIGAYETHHYTQASNSTRQDVEQAEQAVDRFGGEQSRETLDRAISAFEAGNYDNANQLADSAESEAQRNRRTRTTLLYGGAAVAGIALLGGGYYVYRSRQQSPDRLR